MNQNAEKNDGLKPDKKASIQKTGGVIQQVGLNMVMIGMVALFAYLVWQRFMGEPGNATANTALLATNPEAERKIPQVDGEPCLRQTP
jgi:hypothetical protein